MKREPGGVQAELRRLPQLTVSQLAERHEALFGKPTKTRNKPHLIKQLSWKIQADAAPNFRAWRRAA